MLEYVRYIVLHVSKQSVVFLRIMDRSVKCNIPCTRVLLDKFLASQLLIPSFMENPHVHYQVHKCPPSDPLLS
jgi:hypothetical protein